MKICIQIVGQLPMIAGWRDVPLALEGLVEAVCIIKLHAPYWFQKQFHDNKRVANSPLRVTEHKSLDWEPAVVTTIPPVYVSLLILLCADIQQQGLKWPWIHFTSMRLCKTCFFFSSLTTITWSTKYPPIIQKPITINWINHHSPSCWQKVWGDSYHPSVYINITSSLPSVTPGTQRTNSATR